MHPLHQQNRRDWQVSTPRTFEGPRGLQGFIEFDTLQGQHVELQDSSSVLSAGSIDGEYQELDGPFYWLRINEESAHIHHTEARALRNALNAALGDEK